MSNKKCISTYLLVMALICLLTLVVPFTKVGFIGNVATILKVFYYIFLVLFIICLSLIIIIGIFSLFKNAFEFATTQEILGYGALFCVLITIIIFVPNTTGGLSIGYSILTCETFLMACFNSTLKLIREIPSNVNILKQFVKTKKEKIEKADSEIENKTVNINETDSEIDESSIKIENDVDDEVLIIPSDENNED